MKAYAQFDPEVGYAQGMNIIAANILVNLNPQNDKEFNDLEFITEYEEQAFWILVFIMQCKEWRQFFLPGTPGIFTKLEKFKNILKTKLDYVYQHFDFLDVDFQLCFGTYFFTLLLYQTPQKFSKRFLDLFLLEGELALFGVLINMIKLCAEQITKI